MLPKNRTPTHPGQMLLKEFLEPLGMSQRAFAEHIDITTARLNEFIKGKRGITVDTAQRLSMALGTTAKLWMNLQTNYELATASEPDTAIMVLAALTKKKVTKKKVAKSAATKSRKRTKLVARSGTAKTQKCGARRDAS